MADLQDFIDNYSPADFHRVKFDWNGEHGDKFRDPNMAFRDQVKILVASQIGTAKAELIRDLFREETRAAKEAWGIWRDIHILAQELLIRDWKLYLDEYIEGASRGMDAYMGTGRISIPKEVARQIADHLAGKKGLEFFVQRFQSLS